MRLFPLVLIRSLSFSLLIIRRSIERIILTVRAEKSSLTSLLTDHGCLHTRSSSTFPRLPKKTWNVRCFLYFHLCMKTARSNFNVDSVPDFTTFRMAHRWNLDDFYVCWHSVTTCSELERWGPFCIIESSVIDWKIPTLVCNTIEFWILYIFE